jgi:hypothetical protein
LKRLTVYLNAHPFDESSSTDCAVHFPSVLAPTMRAWTVLRERCGDELGAGACAI